MWEAAYHTDAPTWRNVRGPAGALRLSLWRLGWDMRDMVTIVTDDAAEIMLTEFSPALLKRALHDGYVRRQEREYADKLEIPEITRVCYDVARKELRSSRRSARDKGVIRMLVCDGSWTLFRAKACGYLVDSDRCPLCKTGPDTLLHRLWQCPAVHFQRKELVTDAQIDFAMSLDTSLSDRLLVTRALFQHPACQYPAPLADGAVHVQWHVELDDQTWAGDIFTDGSCTRHSVPDLQRAGWGVAVFRDKQLVCEAWGPVWAPTPQTPQAAEFCAYSFAAQRVQAAATVLSDCQNVVTQAGKPLSMQLSWRRPYASAFVSARRGSGKIADVQKVAAHKDPDEVGITDEERYKRRGNDAADKAAGRGAATHPVAEPQDRHDLEFRMRMAKSTLDLACCLLPLWPRLDLSGAAREVHNPVPANCQEVENHAWVFISHFWRCAKCLRVRRSESRPPLAGCQGGNGLDLQVMQRNGHNIVSLRCTDGAVLYGCHKCHAYTSHGSGHRLTELACTGHSTREKSRAWRCICDGVHPRLPGVGVEDVDLHRWAREDSRLPLLSLESSTPPATTSLC